MVEQMTQEALLKKKKNYLPTYPDFVVVVALYVQPEAKNFVLEGWGWGVRANFNVSIQLVSKWFILYNTLLLYPVI